MAIKTSAVTKLEWVLRIGVFGTFLGHGVLAISVNPSWVSYLTLFGLTLPQISVIMPVIGSLDLIVAVIILLKPNKYILLWAIFWAFATAVIRPISGEDIWSFVERAANWALPLAVYFYRIDKK